MKRIFAFSALLFAISIVTQAQFTPTTHQWGLSLFRGLSDDRKSLYGYKDSMGVVVLKAQFDMGDKYLTRAINPVCKDYKWGYIDRQGKQVGSFKWDYAYQLGQHGIESLALVNIGDHNWRDMGIQSLSGFNDGKVGFVDSTGRVVIPVKYTYIGLFFGSVAPFSTSDNIREWGLDHTKGNPLFGFMNKQGKQVIAQKYDNVEPYPINERYYIVSRKGLFGTVDNKTGKEVISPKFTKEEVAELISKLPSMQ